MKSAPEKSKAGVPAERKEAKARRKKGSRESHEDRVREYLLKEVGPDGWEAYQEINDERTTLSQSALGYFYSVGEKFHALTSKHGRGGAAKVARALEISEATVSNAITFATTYSREDLQDLLRRTDDKGRILSWDRMQAVLTARDDRRDHFLELAYKKDISANELRALIQEDYGGKRSSGGRKPSVPSSFTGVVAKMGAMHQKLSRFWDALHDGGDDVLGRLVREMPRERLEGQVRAAIAERRQELDTIAEGARREASRLSDLLRYCDGLDLAEENAGESAEEADTAEAVTAADPEPSKEAKAQAQAARAAKAAKNGRHAGRDLSPIS